MKIRTIAIGVVAAALVLGNTSAQEYEQLAPKQPQPGPGGTVESKEPPRPAVKDAAEVLLPELKGLVFVPLPKDIKAGGVSKPGVDLSQVMVPDADAYRKLAASYVGKPLTKGKLDALIRDTIVFYREHDRPVVDVIVPEQDITSGVVQIVLLEGKVGRVTADGNHWFSTNILTGDLRAKPGDSIRASKLQSDLDWINQNPFRSANLLFSPGAGIGQTDLQLQVRDRFPFRVYAGYEDSGNQVTGYDRYLAGFNWGNAFGLDHQMNYQYTTSNDWKSVQGHAGSYVIPLPWRHNLTFFGSYATSEAELLPITLEGQSWQASTRYEIPIQTIDIDGVGKLRQTLSAGFDFKNSNNNLGFGGSSVFATESDIVQWVAGYRVSMNDPYGATSMGFSVTVSPGNMTSNNSDVDFQSQRAFAESQYTYETLTLERSTRLPWDFTLILRSTLQWSNENLLASEQLGFGGYNSIRGYDMYAVTADEGYLFTTELRTPPVSIAQLFGDDAAKVANDQLQFLGFWDYGMAENVYLLPGESYSTSLSSVGVGLRYSLNTYLSVRFDYGWQLHRVVLDNHHGSRGELGIIVSY